MDARSWFERKTYHHRDFADLGALVSAKETQGIGISLCIPTLNEAATIGPIVEVVVRELMERSPLVDQVAIMDSSSEDGTAEVAAAAGAEIFQDRDILPELEHFGGKGDAMWKSLFVLRGDLIAWVDADVTNFHPRFVYGIVGPLLTDPELGYVKAFYERPLGREAGAQELGGGRVTELMARPLLNALVPELAGFVQPLSGEYAGRREVLSEIPFFTGYAVEVGLLMDLLERFGLDAMAQVDLEQRHHRNRLMSDLSPMAFGILQAVLDRLGSRGLIDLRTPVGRNLHMFRRLDSEQVMEDAVIRIHERPPAATVPGYPAR